jgi:chromosome segregation ATPase
MGVEALKEHCDALVAEIDRLRAENATLREREENAVCIRCGFPALQTANAEGVARLRQRIAELEAQNAALYDVASETYALRRRIAELEAASRKAILALAHANESAPGLYDEAYNAIEAALSGRG